MLAGNRPTGAAWGTTTLICQTPVSPGAKPLKRTSPCRVKSIPKRFTPKQTYFVKYGPAAEGVARLGTVEANATYSTGMDTLLADLRNGFRFLRKTPGFTLVALAALALGIGANTAIFSVVNAVLLRPLPYREPDRLMAVVRKYRQGQIGWATSVPKFVVWKQSPALERMAAYDFAAQGFSLSGGDVPEQVTGVRVSLDYFGPFGAAAELGRTFVEEEDRPGGPQVAVVSEGLWKRRFGGDPGMAGKSITLAGEPYTVVGVLSGAFRPDPVADLWLPLQADPATTNHAHYLRVAARLKPGITLEAANAQLGAVGEQFRRQYGDR